MHALLEVDPARTAILTVDMQRQYLDLDLPGSPVPAADADRVLAASRRVLDFARRSGMPVIHAYVQRRPVESERGLDVSQAKRLKEAQQGLLPSDRMAGSPEAELPTVLVA